MKLTIVDASFHRNGICGVGFYAVLFDDAEYGRMIASLFDEPGYCAVYNVGELAKGNVAFAQGNSFRGDRYEDELRPLVEKFLKENGGKSHRPVRNPERARKDGRLTRTQTERRDDEGNRL